jgi:DNA processing protein
MNEGPERPTMFEASSDRDEIAEREIERLEREAYGRLWLTPGLGPTRVASLIEALGSARAIFQAPRAMLERVDGVGPKLAEAVRSERSLDELHGELEDLAKIGAELIVRIDHRFPQALLSLSDCPLALTMKGSLIEADAKALSIVGSRKSTLYGRRVAGKLAGELARAGITIVSGLARGIDGLAHQSALDAGGRTIAVLASGLETIYPPEHDGLARAIVDSGRGALVSEARVAGVPEAGLFPRRNRVISGLALGTLVVEASKKSGTLSTARHALDQNRDVLAVPGRVGDPLSEGTNYLIKNGAAAVTSIDDVFDALPALHPSAPIERALSYVPAPSSRPMVDAKTTKGRQTDQSTVDGAGSIKKTLVDADLKRTRSGSGETLKLTRTDLPADELGRRLITAIGAEELSLEELIDRTGLSAGEIAGRLLMLEMSKQVVRLPGNRYARG